MVEEQMAANGDENHEEAGIQIQYLKGHTKDRADLLPWDSCGPDCRACAEFEK